MDLLWTDKCFLSVLSVSLLIILLSCRKQPIRLAFKTIFKKPLAVSAAIVLLFFLIIAVMDSLHWNASASKNTTLNRNDSLLDQILTPLGTFYEKTYSAPLSLTLYTAETLLVNNALQQVYPRLNYIPLSITNNSDRNFRILHLLASAFFTAVLITLLLGIFIFFMQLILYKKLRFLPNQAICAGLLTFFIGLLLIFTTYWLSREFHVLGTGKIGQDIFYYTVKSIRTGLVIGILTTLFMLPLALFFGIAAGYWGGLMDDVIQYIYTTLSSIPGVLLITASVLSMQTYIANHPQQFPTLSQSADARLFALCLILGVTSWTSLCRLLRAEALKLREIDYVSAARALGSNAFTILRKHLLPNVMYIVLITLILDFSFLVLAEAVLSYVGVGVSPMTISWGNMINGARLELAREPIVWWPILSAFIFMFILVLSSNLLADAVRDAFDPRLK